MPNPNFSIVTPTFNQLDWLSLCIASVRDQALPSTLDSGLSTPAIEHIIQDAGTPGIEELARELGAEFYRDGQLIFHAKECGVGVPPAILQATTDKAANYSLKFFSEKDAGMYDAINRGLARSSGEICAWLNSDEQYLPYALCKAADLFKQRPELDVLLGDAILLNSAKWRLSTSVPKLAESSRQMRLSWALSLAIQSLMLLLMLTSVSVNRVGSYNSGLPAKGWVQSLRVLSTPWVLYRRST